MRDEAIAINDQSTTAHHKMSDDVLLSVWYVYCCTPASAFQSALLVYLQVLLVYREVVYVYVVLSVLWRMK